MGLMSEELWDMLVEQERKQENHDIDWTFVNIMHAKWVRDHPEGVPATWWSI
jgi:hypothetical protein